MKVWLLNILLIVSGFTVSAQTAFETIYQRLYSEALENPSNTEIQSILNDMSNNGSFPGLNYNSSSDDLRDHLRNINKLASAYQNSNSGYYQNTNAKEKYFLGLTYWINTNHTPSNWWFRHIAYPKETWPGVILMSDELANENSSLYNSALNYLTWAYLQNDYMTGANGADKIAGAFPAYILTQNNSRMLTIAGQIKDLIAIQNEGEGFEPDYMFSQHSRYGRQTYLATYGGEYFRSLFAYIEFVHGTTYAVSATEYTLLEDYFIKGVQWPIYNEKMDPSQTGRKNSNTAGVGALGNRAQDLVNLNTPRKLEVEQVVDRLRNGNGASTLLTGNRMFWRLDYMIHRRAGYYSCSRMTSTRTVGNEAGLGQGEYNYHSGAGVNYIMRTGDEYGGNYFNVFDERHFPGTTVEQDNGSLPIPNWGLYGENGNAFAGGVSNGEYGASGMLHNRRGVRARKSWFYFDNEFVALGAGINQSDGTAPIETTINQCVQTSTVTYAQNGNVSSLSSGSVDITDPDWVLQDQVGYVNLRSGSPYTIKAENKSGTNIFTCTVDHGTNPNTGYYAYAVYPGADQTLLTNYAASNPITILNNSATLQAVEHADLNITQMVFFQPGNVTNNSGLNIAVNEPAVVMLKEDGENMEISIANPLCETDNPSTITLTLNQELSGNGASWNGTQTTINFNMPSGDFAGQTVTEIFTRDLCPAVVASSHDGNLPANTLDDDLNTRWSAEGDGEYIEYCLGDVMNLGQISIAFYLGDQRTTSFDISVSENGTDWTTVLENAVSSGTSLDLEAFNFTAVPVWKFRITGHGNSNSAWNSITEVDWSGTTTGVENENTTLASIYPNPSQGDFDVVLHGNENSTLRMYNVNGQLVHEQQLSAGSTHLSLQHLPAGVYWVQVASERHSQTSKLLIAR